MAVAPGKIGSRALTSELRKLAQESHTVTTDGTPLTREQVLADLIWKQALGWVEVIEERDDSGTMRRKEIVHPPVAWCQQFLFERMEGKAPIAQGDSTGGVRAADKVRDLARQRINLLAKTAAGPPKRPAPTPKGDA